MIFNKNSENTCKFRTTMIEFTLRLVTMLLHNQGSIELGVMIMKKGIHPDYKQTTIRCACGNIIETGSTKENITVEICSKCHPFYTGKQKLVDTSGRVDRFNKKYGIK